MESLAHSLHPVLVPHRLGLLSRVVRVVLTAVVGVLCYQLSPRNFERISRLMMGWDGFRLAVLQLTGFNIFHARTGENQRETHKVHPARTWVLLLTVTLVCTAISLLAVVLLLRGSAPDEPRRTVGARAGVDGGRDRYLAAAAHAVCPALRTHVFQPGRGSGGRPRAGRVVVWRGRTHFVLGFCLLPVRGWNDDSNRRCDRDLTANAPAGAVSRTTGLCL